MERYIEDNLSYQPPVPCEFEVGDTVTFTNSYGVKFEGLKVIGFSSKDNNLFKYGNFIHLDSESYWFPHKPEELKLEKKAGH